LYYGLGTVTYDLQTGTDAKTTVLPGVTSGVEITGLTNGTTYHAVVTAVNANGESQWSAEVEAKPSATAVTGDLVDLGNGITMRFASIPRGTFTMGSPADERYSSSDEKPQHQVTLSAFRMQTTEVTQEQYERVMGTNPSYWTTSNNSYANTASQPVEQVSWWDCVRFCNKLSSDQRLTPCYTNSGGSTTIADGDTVSCSWTADGFRLPTEAEWEYACRAGTSGMFYWGTAYDEAQMKQYCWYNLNCYDGSWTEPHAEKGGTQRVATRLPNDWGLYDMSGNVLEWCWDWDGSYTSESESNPRGPEAGSRRVLRGGGWWSDWNFCRSADRVRLDPGYRGDDLGFRLVRAIP